MKHKILPLILHIIFASILTIFTLTHGVLWLFCMLILRQFSFLYQLLCFILLSSLVAFFILPNIAPLFGRQQLALFHHNVKPHFFYVWANRTYMHHSVINENNIPYGLENTKITYLDAAFPFDLPILPHLSHQDGLKLDIRLPFKKPVSPFGYFIYAKASNEAASLCGRKYNKGAAYDKEKTTAIVTNLIQNPKVKKIFMEPWIKQELKLTNAKIRFAGCYAARHDDHIHIDF